MAFSIPTNIQFLIPTSVLTITYEKSNSVVFP